MYSVPVYKPQPLWVEAMYFFFVAVPIAGLVITAIHIAFWIIDSIRWVKHVTNVVGSALSGKTKAASGIVGSVGCENPAPRLTQ